MCKRERERVEGRESERERGKDRGLGREREGEISSAGQCRVQQRRGGEPWAEWWWSSRHQPSCV